MQGKHHSKQSINQISKSNTGKKRTQETKDNIRKATLNQLANGKSNNPWARKLYYKNTSLHYQGTYELDFLDNFHGKVQIENGKTFSYLDPANEKKDTTLIFICQSLI